MQAENTYEIIYPLASHLPPAELETVIHPGLLFKLSPATS